MLNKTNKENCNHINSVRVRGFRSHEDIFLKPGKESVLIAGSNGVGKTSILEAISLFGFGKGIRNASFNDMTNQDKDNFTIDLNLNVKSNITLEYRTFYNKVNKIRKIFINNKETSASLARKNIPMLWIAPYTEKIFTGSSSMRRLFIDRLVNIFDNEHSSRLNEYEKCLRQRAKLLKDRSKDFDWLDVLEKQMASLSVAISSSRLETINSLSKHFMSSVKLFPKIEIFFSNSIETTLQTKAAIDVEENLRDSFLQNRAFDKLLGGSRVGCHKTDLIVNNIDKGLSAELCSSGEQKSLLISIVLAASLAFFEYSNRSPIILLDEVFTHLDSQKKISLLEKLIELESQIWVTATEKENFFQNKRNFCYHHLTKDGLQNV